MLVKLLNEYAKLPTRGTVDSAELDIYCPFNITVMQIVRNEFL